MGVPLTHSPSALSLVGWTLESEALMRGMGTWLLVCTWVGLGVSVAEDGEGEGTRDHGRWVGSASGTGLSSIKLHRGPFGPNCARVCPPGTSLDSSPIHVPWSEPIPCQVSQPCP